MADKKTGIRVAGTGLYVPEKILSNRDLEKMVDTSDEWITKRTGIKERHIAEKDEATSDMAAIAAKIAIEDAGINPEDINIIVTATATPDMVFPSTSCTIADSIGAGVTAAFDISAACTGFIYAMGITTDILMGRKDYKYGLVIGADTLSRITDYEDRETCVLFGDGAGVAVLEKSDSSSGIIDYIIKADGQYGDLLKVPASGSRNPASVETLKNRLHFMKMEGRATFKIAVKNMTMIAEEILEKNNTKSEELDMVVCHQANIRILEAVRKRLKLPEEKMYYNIQKYGNTSAGTIAIALDEVRKKGLVKKGSKVLLVAFGGGFTWGAILLTI